MATQKPFQIPEKAPIALITPYAHTKTKAAVEQKLSDLLDENAPNS